MLTGSLFALQLPIDFAAFGGIVGVVLFLFFFAVVVIAKQYKRCPSNKVLVIYGKVGSNQASRCLHGGGKLVVPLIQDYGYLSLEPMTIEIPLEGALSLNNIRVNVPSTFTVGVSTAASLMNLAAERLLHLSEAKIAEQAQDIILGQLRLVIATLSIEEINKDREKFMALINENVTEEINKVGLELINVNIRDITDESGYIEAIGKRAAAEAVNKARVDVAEQERDGETGSKEAEEQRRVKVAALEARAIQGEVQAQRDYEIAKAQRGAETVAASKQAEQEQRVQVAQAEASAIEGENTSAASIAESNAKLAEVRAAAQQRADVATAEAQQAILEAERLQELARLSKEELAKQEITKRRVEIAAEAAAEKYRREAAGEADAIIAKYNAEAEGTRKLLEAKAEGYRQLVAACEERSELAPVLLLVEQLPSLVAEQVKAVQNLKIDKITVWDSGSGSNGGTGSTSQFLSSLIGALPPVHDLAKQAGIELPQVLGTLAEQPDTHIEGNTDVANVSA